MTITATADAVEGPLAFGQIHTEPAEQGIMTLRLQLRDGRPIIVEMNGLDCHTLIERVQTHLINAAENPRTTVSGLEASVRLTGRRLGVDVDTLSGDNSETRGNA